MEYLLLFGLIFAFAWATIANTNEPLPEGCERAQGACGSCSEVSCHHKEN